MGTGTSRLVSDPPRTRVSRSRRARARLSSLLMCGCSSSHARHEMEEHPKVHACCSKDCSPTTNAVQKPLEESSLEISREAESSSTNAETGTSSESSDQTCEYAFVANDLSSVEMNKQGKCLTKTPELFAPCQVSDESCWDRSSTVASTSFREEQSSNPVNISFNKEPIDGIENSENESVSHIFPVPRDPLSQELTYLPSNAVRDETHLDDFRVREANNSGTDSVTNVSGLQVTSDPVSSDSGFPVSNSGGNDSLPDDAPVTTASSILSSITNNSSNLEAQRSQRRLVLDAISRRGSGRLTEVPNVDFAGGDGDDRGSQNRRFVDSNGNLSGDGSSMNGGNEWRRRSGSQIWGRLLSGINENEQRDNLCPFGVHPDGSCSCDSFLTNDESSIHASISRIVRLAEALFEVLDEIHHRPGSFSLPLVSLPAPESVVDSFPLKNHTKLESAESGDDIQQCYICLSEYEEGDKIRVLPCHHEYHMACVDKWLKEIHGVCPLCRGDVSQGVSVTEDSSSENPFL